jgi:hypothetical protein
MKRANCSITPTGCSPPRSTYSLPSAAWQPIQKPSTKKRFPPSHQPSRDSVSTRRTASLICFSTEVRRLLLAVSLRCHVGVPIHLTGPPSTPSPAPGARPRKLRIRPVYQKGKNLCWAAVGEMVIKHLGTRIPSPKQCEIAAIEHGQSPKSCCKSPIPSACDQTAWPDNTYLRYGVAYKKHHSSVSQDACRGLL